MMDDRTLPHNLEAEKSVLGAILINNLAFQQAADVIDAHDFFRDAHRRIFSKMTALTDRNEPVDFVTLTEELTRSGELDEVGGPAYVSALSDGVPRSANVQYYARIVKEKSTLRRLIQASNEVLVRAYDADEDAAAVAADLVASVQPLTEGGSGLRVRSAELTYAVERERIWREAKRVVEDEAAEALTALSDPALERLDAFLAREIASPVPRIADVLHQGQRALLVAQHKAGKTTLVDNLIASLTDGRPFLGRYATVPIEGTLVRLDFEMSEGQLQSWSRVHGIRRSDRVYVIAMRGRGGQFDIRIPRVRSQWAKTLRDVGTSFLIVDCARPIMDSLGLDEHKQAGVLLTAVDALLAEAGISEACIVQHAGHQGERARGDSRFRDWPDVAWTLTRETEDERSPRFFSAFGRDIDVPEQRLDYDPLTRRLTVAGGSRRDRVTERALEEVLAVLRASDVALSGRAIWEELESSGADSSRSAVRQAIKLGIKSGAVHTSEGPKRAVLHRASAPVRRSAPDDTGSLGDVCAPTSLRTAHSHTPKNTEVPTDGVF